MDGPFDSAPIEEIALHHAPLVKVVTQVRFPKCCRMEVRAWSGISGWELVLPDGGVGKVDVGEAAPEAHLDAGKRGPALASLGAEPLAE